ncbi:MAG: hypothetical protein LBB08_01435 [Rickettsiales bacterium]|jgi:hypothetical protein|nr:hypothetical protein [Rickettsiales bacterium]
MRIVIISLLLLAACAGNNDMLVRVVDKREDCSLATNYVRAGRVVMPYQYARRDYYVGYDVPKNEEFDGLVDGEVQISARIFDSVKSGMPITFEYDPKRDDARRMQSRRILTINGHDVNEFIAETGREDLEREYAERRRVAEQELRRQQADAAARQSADLERLRSQYKAKI